MSREEIIGSFGADKAAEEKREDERASREEPGVESSGENGGEKKELTPEERRINAAKRREAEKRAFAEEAVRRALDAERRQKSEAKINAEIAEIHKLDPTISSVADLIRAPYAKKFREYVERGNTFIDSYYLANRETVENAMAEKAREQAASNMRSKGHLKATGGARGSGSLNVPPDVMELYRDINPSATEAEIQSHYNRSRKK